MSRPEGDRPRDDAPRPSRGDRRRVAGGDHARTFEALRSHVFRVAYQMVGSAADAEDLVQEAWIRWSRVDPASIESPRAWLTRVVARLAINHLTSARVRRERYVGTWLPEPIRTAEDGLPAAQVELDESLSLFIVTNPDKLGASEQASTLFAEPATSFLQSDQRE